MHHCLEGRDAPGYRKRQRQRQSATVCRFNKTITEAAFEVVVALAQPGLSITKHTSISETTFKQFVFNKRHQETMSSSLAISTRYANRRMPELPISRVTKLQFAAERNLISRRMMIDRHLINQCNRFMLSTSSLRSLCR